MPQKSYFKCVRALPLRKTFLKLYFKIKKCSFCYSARGGDKALVAAPLKNNFFAASLMHLFRSTGVDNSFKTSFTLAQGALSYHPIWVLWSKHIFMTLSMTWHNHYMFRYIFLCEITYIPLCLWLRSIFLYPESDSCTTKKYIFSFLSVVFTK